MAEAKNAKHEYIVPTKQINNPMVFGKFQRSQGYHTLIKFISRTSSALVNTTMLTELEISPTVQSLIQLLDSLDEAIDRIPPEEQKPGAVRFGNPSYRKWFERMHEIVKEKLAEILAEFPGADNGKNFFFHFLTNHPRVDCLSLRIVWKCD